MIKGIRERTGVEIDCEDDGTVELVGTDAEALELAKQIVLEIAVKPEVGTVVRCVLTTALTIALTNISITSSTISSTNSFTMCLQCSTAHFQ